MKKLTTGNIYISQSKIPNAGRGVFTKVGIKKGEIIERCPVIEIPENDTANLNGSFLVTYFYYLGKKKDRLVLALGYGSIYNHAKKPNARYKESQGEIDFIAIKEINKDEEITVNYLQGNHNIKNPLWFKVGNLLD